MTRGRLRGRSEDTRGWLVQLREAQEHCKAERKWRGLYILDKDMS